MMKIVKRRKTLFSIVLGEVYFAPHISTRLPGMAECDLVSFLGAKKPVPGARAVRTLHLDLALNEDTLFKGMSKSTRYKIHRAQEQDHLIASVIVRPSNWQIQEFSEFYGRWAATKGLRTNRIERLLALNECGALVLANVQDSDHELLCWDSYVVDGQRALRDYTPANVYKSTSSPERSLQGRATRYLIWKALKTFKAAGFALLDLGYLSGPPGAGVFPGNDAYKRGFGGCEVVQYDYRCGQSLAGKLTNFAWSTLERYTMPPEPSAPDQDGPGEVTAYPKPAHSRPVVDS